MKDLLEALDTIAKYKEMPPPEFIEQVAKYTGITNLSEPDDPHYFQVCCRALHALDSRLVYVNGDATYPESPGQKVIVHVCNNVGGWGAGFVLAVSKRWTLPEAEYRKSFEQPTKPALGDVQFVKVEHDIHVANLIGQVGIDLRPGKTPIRYEAVRKGLKLVAQFCKENKATVHMPQIGAGLAGGNWNVMEDIIRQELCMRGVKATVYIYLDKSSPSYVATQPNTNQSNTQ